MTDRISGTLVNIRREDDGQAGYNTVYIVDVGGRQERAFDFGDYGGPRPKVGAQVVLTGRRSTSGTFEVHSLQT